jgi:transcriptional regulator with XRE-family HTH domain
MYDLTRKEKRDFILKKIKELELTAYDIGKKTKLSVSGVEKIINGTVKNPQEETLNKILIFLENKVLGSELNNKEIDKVEESSSEYPAFLKTSDKDIIEDLIKKINAKDQIIKILLEKIDILTGK